MIIIYEKYYSLILMIFLISIIKVIILNNIVKILHDDYSINSIKKLLI